jgi:hypothetical protein
MHFPMFVLIAFVAVFASILALLFPSLSTKKTSVSSQATAQGSTEDPSLRWFQEFSFDTVTSNDVVTEIFVRTQSMSFTTFATSPIYNRDKTTPETILNSVYEGLVRGAKVCTFDILCTATFEIVVMYFDELSDDQKKHVVNKLSYMFLTLEPTSKGAIVKSADGKNLCEILAGYILYIIKYENPELCTTLNACKAVENYKLTFAKFPLLRLACDSMWYNNTYYTSTCEMFKCDKLKSFVTPLTLVEISIMSFGCWVEIKTANDGVQLSFFANSHNKSFVCGKIEFPSRKAIKKFCSMGLVNMCLGSPFAIN